MRVIGARRGGVITLTRIRKRMGVWPHSVSKGHTSICKTDIRVIPVPGFVSATVIAGKHLAEIDAGDFLWTSADRYLTLSNQAAITSIITTKGLGAGTVITESRNTGVGVVSAERVA